MSASRGGVLVEKNASRGGVRVEKGRVEKDWE